MADLGVLLILLGLVAAGVVTDVVIESPPTNIPDQALVLFGRSISLSAPEAVLGAAVLGGLAILLVIVGVGLLRGSWGRRRGLRQRVAQLERENDELRSKAHLASIVGEGEGPAGTDREAGGGTQ